MSFTVLTFQGDPTDPTVMAGVTHAIYSELDRRGLAVEPPMRGMPLAIDLPLRAVALARWGLEGGLPPRRFRHPRALLQEAGISHLPFAGISRLAGRRVAGDERITDVITYGAYLHDFPPAVRLITYEDMTVLQGARSSSWWLSRVPRAEIRRLVKFVRRTYDRATVCCVPTAWVKDSMVEEFGVAPEKIAVVGIGRNRSPAYIAERNWDSPHFLYVGMNWERKNGAMVLRAFERVRASLPDARLSVVGPAPALSAPGVTFYGLLSLGDAGSEERFAEIFAQATCFVLPALIETAGIANIEAMSAGLPVIGPTVGGAAELIGEGGTAVDPLAEDELVAAMERFADPQVASATGTLAARRAEQFTWPLVVQRMLDAAAAAEAGEAPG